MLMHTWVSGQSELRVQKFVNSGLTSRVFQKKAEFDFGVRLVLDSQLEEVASKGNTEFDFYKDWKIPHSN